MPADPADSARSAPPRLRPAPEAAPGAVIGRIGLTGLVVRFGDTLSEPANRAAIAFGSALREADWPGVSEVSASLVSAFVRFDPLVLPHAEVEARLRELISARDWTGADLPRDRRRHEIPCAFGGGAGPQFAELCDRAGLSHEAAVAELTGKPVRVLALGFAPGQGYLGQLSEHWDAPRLADLHGAPQGALLLALRQLIVFTAASRTGWPRAGLTAFRSFRPEAEDPFPLRPGDEVRFRAVSEEDIELMRAAGEDGARTESLP